MKERSTMDLVILLWAGTVAITLIVGTVSVVVGKIVHPSMNIEGGGEIIANIVMAIVGFIGGRAVGKHEAANGQ
jgi:hypothetical protein